MRIIISALILLTFSANAQIKEYQHFADFEKDYLQPNNDTTYVINFWATWCIPCVKELPYFEELNKKYQNQKVKVVLVSLDFTMQQVEAYADKKSLKSEIVLLSDSKTNSWIDKVDSSWSGAIPITLFIKGDEKQFYEKDYHNIEELENDLLKIKNL
jgi:thiol-disulfide isomerase/thioredoxin